MVVFAAKKSVFHPERLVQKNVPDTIEVLLEHLKIVVVHHAPAMHGGNVHRRPVVQAAANAEYGRRAGVRERLGEQRARAAARSGGEDAQPVGRKVPGKDAVIARLPQRERSVGAKEAEGARIDACVPRPTSAMRATHW